MHIVILVVIVLSIIILFLTPPKTQAPKTDEEVTTNEPVEEVVKPTVEPVAKEKEVVEEIAQPEAIEEVQVAEPVEESVAQEEQRETQQGDEPSTKIARDIFRATNDARTNPSNYLSSVVMPYHDSIQESGGQSYVLIGRNTRLLLNEGKVATNELINYLRSAQPREAMTYDTDLEKAARDHALDIGENSILGHSGSDGSTVGERVTRHRSWTTVGENIAYGTRDGADVIRGLLIDDGVKSRGHRDNIMATNFKKMGAYCAEHGSQYGYSCVIVYAN